MLQLFAAHKTAPFRTRRRLNSGKTAIGRQINTKNESASVGFVSIGGIGIGGIGIGLGRGR
jgi:hypothetical protein